ncbi:sulfatase-like hydrolase/transferase [Flavobacterium sp. UMI-01]|uniref:sulfatase-like hydrolase/transferase n=1 Tax=Flavobacterium sp. UMI-01 TaxID=1441053 RepID=UPI002088CC2C|nr:sulfatase-like hydrolase/transferase [Flavobacterium sp. UMI-01]GIZ09640.1 choline-sulfatase [Flavobacterium sp. UMI-01]
MENRKPNIVFIFTDDQTYTSIHALGNKEIQTPNMDALVKNGTTFTHAYNMGAWNGAVCVASRAMLISGRFLWRANAISDEWAQKEKTALTWGKLMEQQGYDTYITGKWHVEAAVDKVFQHTKNIRGGMAADAWNHGKMVATFEAIKKNNGSFDKVPMPNGYNRPLSEDDKSWLPYDTSNGGFWQGGKHWSVVVKDDAIAYINEAKTKENPFFMYLAFNAPHDPRQAPKEYQEKYPLRKISVPQSFLPEYPFRRDMGNNNNLRDEALAPFPRTKYAVKVHTQEYYASITYADEQIGLILDALKKSGKMDNTYIIFTADHGLAMGRHGLMGKQSLFDHSIRAPFVIVGPDIPKNKKVDADIYLQDAMATALDLAGAPKPKYVEFHSLMDLAKGKTTKSNYKGIYGAYLDLQRMIRKDGYKLIVFPKIQKVLLFDLNKDPEEMQDIAGLSANKIKVKALFKDLQQLQKEMGDPLDISNIFQTL